MTDRPVRRAIIANSEPENPEPIMARSKSLFIAELKLCGLMSFRCQNTRLREMIQSSPACKIDRALTICRAGERNIATLAIFRDLANRRQNSPGAIGKNLLFSPERFGGVCDAQAQVSARRLLVAH
jgi:hypothetical protein